MPSIGRMNSTYRMGLRLFALLLTLFPATVNGQAPSLLRQWGTAGSGPGQFAYPVGVALDHTGNVYISDFVNNNVQKFTRDGSFILGWGTTGSGNGQLINPYGIAVDAAGDVWVADMGNNRLQHFSSSGIYLGQMGSYGSGPGQFIHPVGVAFDAAGNLLVTDHQNHRIVKMHPSGVFLMHWPTSPHPYGIACDASGAIFVVSSSGDLRRFNDGGLHMGSWMVSGSAPRGLAVDAFGHVHVALSTTPAIQMFSGTGDMLSIWGTSGSTNGGLNAPHGLAFAEDGTLYVVDAVNEAVQVYGYAATPVRTTSWSRLKALFH